MSIHIGDMHSFRALADLCDRFGWFPLTAWIEGDRLAWFVRCLRHVPDSSIDFLNGKWATIQYLETLLDGEAKAEVEHAIGLLAQRGSSG